MKRPLALLICGLVLGLLAGAASFKLLRKPPAPAGAPELGWLAAEFHLSQAECERVEEFHKAYQQQCAQMCQKIAAKNQEIRGLLQRTNVVTAGISQKLREAAELRAECHAHMLEHFLRVSAEMPPEQGRRYLDWVLERTILADSGMVSHAPSGARHGQH
jgi:hypothetical protein